MSLVAYTLGARVIEKHFTLDRSLKGTDHSFSLEPQGMRKLVRDLDRAKLAMGDGVKRKFDSESLPLQKMGKMIVANTNLPSGHILEYKDVAFRSPANGLAPSELRLVIGRQLKSSLEKDDPITIEILNEI
jgi:N-acetylneuraminate synthase/sialic acid synthase